MVRKNGKKRAFFWTCFCERHNTRVVIMHTLIKKKSVCNELE